MLRIEKEWLTDRLKIKSIPEVAEEIGCHPETLRRKVKSFGIVKSRHGHLIREDFFKTWSKDMAYILGFAFADGSVGKYNNRQKLVFQINPKDMCILEFMRDLIQPTRSIYRYDRIQTQTKRPFEIAMIDFSSKTIVEDLISLGCVEDKTHKEIKIPEMPEEFERHFIRGLFDGDGSIWVTQNGESAEVKYGANICCTSISMLEGIQKRLGIGHMSLKSNPPSIQFYSKSDIADLGDYLYSDGGFCLDRKKLKFEIVTKTSEEIRTIIRESR